MVAERVLYCDPGPLPPVSVLVKIDGQIQFAFIWVERELEYVLIAAAGAGEEVRLHVSHAFVLGQFAEMGLSYRGAPSRLAASLQGVGHPGCWAKR